ncbi:DUF4856 domain-containing protein [Mangrovivirga sp. M17]|uniref:DUF4856 domain-containing protein n=1 Tax=Mangrovivirga halotolerans TaxID=2993936 RepID=A0ABT3RSL1_9BACT|nr:DUF4856 domain-containing protein [Mangrovivirga halotolerans]MCX2744782.1 DUF4856 domain-containing protein [Mangrovivirga halotolerans]
MRRLFLPLAFAAVIFGCSDDTVEPVNNIEVPSTYTFERNGQSSVSYSGQTARLNMLAEIKAYASKAHNFEEVSYSQLSNMYSNTENPFQDESLNTSGKQLFNKTAIGEEQEMLAIMQDLATISADVAVNKTLASEGKSGILYRNADNTKPIVVNEKGWEHVQFIEKGLMGSVFIYQMLNTQTGYLSNTKLNVDNENLVDGKNYTAMEHHWDEAFGYWGAPVDYPMNPLTVEEDRFWAKYTQDVHEHVPVATSLSEAFRTGRAAIVAKNYGIRNSQREVIVNNLEFVIAATALHYINSVLQNQTAPTGEKFHALSEAYMFIEALKYVPQSYITIEQINQILNTHLGQDGDFWTVTTDGLTAAKSILTESYPDLKPLQDEL